MEGSPCITEGGPDKMGTSPYSKGVCHDRKGTDPYILGAYPNIMGVYTRSIVEDFIA